MDSQLQIKEETVGFKQFLEYVCDEMFFLIELDVRFIMLENDRYSFINLTMTGGNNNDNFWVKKKIGLT